MRGAGSIFLFLVGYTGIAAPAVAARRGSTAQLTSAPFVTLSGQQTWEQLLMCPVQGHSWA